MFKKQLKQIGNSLALFIPENIVKYEGLKKDDWVEVRIRKIKKPKEVYKNG